MGGDPFTTICDTYAPCPGGPIAASSRPMNYGSAGGYDCTGDTKRRKPPRSLLRSEDDELLPIPRGQAITLGRDVRRNFAIAAWAIRKHLDYVSTFHYHCRSGDKAVDDRVEELMRWWAKAKILTSPAGTVCGVCSAYGRPAARSTATWES